MAISVEWGVDTLGSVLNVSNAERLYRELFSIDSRPK